MIEADHIALFNFNLSLWLGLRLPHLLLSLDRFYFLDLDFFWRLFDRLNLGNHYGFRAHLNFGLLWFMSHRFHFGSLHLDKGLFNGSLDLVNGWLITGNKLTPKPVEEVVDIEELCLSLLSDLRPFHII